MLRGGGDKRTFGSAVSEYCELSPPDGGRQPVSKEGRTACYLGLAAVAQYRSVPWHAHRGLDFRDLEAIRMAGLWTVTSAV